jgi:hypothetical protein
LTEDLAVGWYELLKLLHILGALIWVGGGVALLGFIIKASLAKSDSILVDTIMQTDWYPPALFGPAAAVILLSGLALAFFYRLWSELWLILGLLGMIGNFAVIPIISSQATRIKLAADSGDLSRAAAIGRNEFLPVIAFDLALLVIIVADMVLKPSADDWGLLIVFAIALLAAIVVLLVPSRRKRVAD